MARSGPLLGLRVVELGAIGPGPFAAMILSDLGAEVIRVEREGAIGFPRSLHHSVLLRGRTSVVVDLKTESGRDFVLDMVEHADVIIEGFRPGVVERLGLGPEECHLRNSALIYGRMTGWGQTGPLATSAGHDINYVAATGVLHAIGAEDGPPQIPINLVGDYGGGGMLLAVGILAAIFERNSSGLGQVVDAAIVDGVAMLGAMMYGALSGDEWRDARGVNRLDGGRPYYRVYSTADSKYLAVGAIEDQFYQELIETLGLDGEDLPDRDVPSSWPVLQERFSRAFLQHTQAEWIKIFGSSDACVTPIVSLGDAREHPQIKARNTLIEVDGVLQPAPAPRFSRTPAKLTTSSPGDKSDEINQILREWGVESENQSR
jgi:alpha-methylacyl-CoA racemase